ncbi:MAG: hydrogenase formation protein HypD [Syntrophales bacterium]|jgi:hydrogenase expression/formation protein HypD
MRFIDEYRDPALARGLLTGIKRIADQLDRNVAIMEVCGSHTTAIGRFGIRALLPENIRLISGPGCPICVTAAADIDRSLLLARQDGVILATYGDMLRVPGCGGMTLQKIKADHGDIRVVASPSDAVSLSEKNPDRQVVFLGIGFETTSPTLAASVLSAREKGINNFSVFSIHKLIPPAMKILMDDPKLRIDGFLCPGHVSIIIGADSYRFITEAGRGAVITGFEPVDILEGIYMILLQIAGNKPDVVIQYARGVKAAGNKKAQEILNVVFEPETTHWRGLGAIPDSGLRFRHEFQDFDAMARFSIPDPVSSEPAGCACGDVLKGTITPDQCPLFKIRCRPDDPVGPCMVSTDGSCAAYYKYY